MEALKMSLLEFRRHPDHKGDDNRGWIEHKINAYIDNQSVGFLNIAYIPKERFLKHYQSALDYKTKIQGWPSFNNEGAITFNNTTSDDIRLLCWYMYRNNKLNEEIKHMSHSKLRKTFSKLKSDCNKQYGQELRDFKAYHVDYPVVAYIFVDPKYRRQGIATNLYIEGGKWMSEFGFRLHSSTIISTSAHAVWNRMRQQKLARLCKERRVDRGRRFCLKN